MTVIAERYSAASDLVPVPVVPFSPLRHGLDPIRELAAIMLDFVHEPMFPALKPSAAEVKMALGLSVIVHAACFAFMLDFGNALFQEERSAGAPNPVWGISASSLGVEIVPLHAFESAANAAKPTKVMPEKEVLEETKPSEIASDNPRGQADRAVEGREDQRACRHRSKGDRGGAAHRGGEAGRT